MDERLLQRIQAGMTPHAVLIAGPSGSGKREMARRAAARYCFGCDDVSRLQSCPNYTETAGASTNIERVRTLMASAAAKAFNGERRSFVLVDAHRMDMRTQNALLKVLEEPPKDTLLILTGSEPGLLPTIRSRCMIRRIGASTLTDTANALVREGVAAEQANLCATAADGVIGLARLYASETGAAFRNTAITILEQALFHASPFALAAELAEEDAPKEGKRKRADANKTSLLFTVWASVLRDALLLPYGMAAQNPDAGKLSGRIAARFTEAEIQGIIETLTTAQQRLFDRASPSLTLDAALAKISLKEKV